MTTTPGLRRAVLSGALCLLAASTPAQQAPGKSTADEAGAQENRAWQRLIEELDRRDEQGFRAPLATRVDRLARFLARLPELPEAGPERPGRARLRAAALIQLGCLHLASHDGTAARRRFGLALELSEATDLDLRGRARFGIAQAYETDAAREEAREELASLVSDPSFAGTRFADWARSALVRLGRRCEVGGAAPEFGPRRDLTGQARTLRDLAGQPVLLMFVSTLDPDGLQRADEVLRAATDAGLAPAQMPILLTHNHDGEAARLARERGWRQPILPSDTAFIDPALLSYRINTLPSWVLIGPDGTLLSRDAPTHRLAAILRQLPR